MFIGPSLKQSLYLGWDFMLKFNVGRDLVDPTISEIDNITVPNNNEPEMHVLTLEEQTQLNSVIELFPSYLKLGLGRTTWLKHSIDTGDSPPI